MVVKPPGAPIDRQMLQVALRPAAIADDEIDEAGGMPS